MEPKNQILLQDVGYTSGKTTILKNVNLNIPIPCRLGITGPSGSGKSTLLRLLNLLLSPSRGVIYYRNRPLKQYDPIDIRKKICLIQQKAVFVKGTIHENLTLASRWDPSFNPDQTALEKILEQVGLSDQPLDKDVRSLSGGEQQRLALARGLLNDPEVLLLDEPTAQLDRSLAQQILDTISELTTARKLTLIIVSHQPELIQPLVDDMLYLKDGHVRQFQTASDPRQDDA